MMIYRRIRYDSSERSGLKDEEVREQILEEHHRDVAQEKTLCFQH
jgi:hypothetical protein